MILSRRSLITGLVSFVAAPAIVRASSIMPVKAWTDDLIPMAFMRTPTIFPLAASQYRAEFIRAIEHDYDMLRPQVLREVVLRDDEIVFEIAAS